MIEDKTKVNENVEFDDGKELTDHLVAQGSVETSDKEQVLIGHQYWEYGQEKWDTRVLGIVYGKLSPNPNGSGYVRQVIIPQGESIAEPQEDTLYLRNGLKFKYLYAPIVDPNTNEIIVPAGWVRVDNLPNLYLKKGERGTPVKENQPPRKRPHVFNEPVAFQDDVLYKGKLLGVEFKQIAVGQYRNDVIIVPGTTNYGINFWPQEWVEFDNWEDPTEEEIEFLQKAMTDFKQKIKSANLIIFTMNNTFVITPVAQNGDTLMLGNFAYNSQGDSAIARLRLKFHNEGVAVLFDDDFGNAMQVAPYGALLVVNF